MHAHGEVMDELKAALSGSALQEAAVDLPSASVQIWNFDGESEVTVAKADDDEDAFSPEKVLNGFNVKDFNVKLVTSTSTNHQVQLIPVDKRQTFKQVLLYINKSTNLVSKAIITDKTNTTIELNFSNISLNVVLPDSQFVFDAAKHPGVEIVNQ